MAVDASGHCYVNGRRQGGVDDDYTSKFDPDGNLIWSKKHGSEGYGIKVDVDGNIIGTGRNLNDITI